MAYVRGFLSAEECAHVIELGRQGGELHPSRVVNYDGDVGVRSEARTSESCRVSAGQDATVMRAVQRAAYLTGLSPNHAEAVQVVHYDAGQQYRPHYDYFSPQDVNYERKCAEMGNRLLSFFVYLMPCEGGGRTYFPKLHAGFTPEKGSAVCWYNLDRHGNLDDRTLHAGEPVTKGEKWGLNVWLRERPRQRKVAIQRRKVATCTLSVACDGAAGPHVHLAIAAQPRPTSPGLSACPACGDITGPIGLCLCTDKYAPPYVTLS